MSDSSIDRSVFAYLASCVGDFVRWPQCKSVDLWGDNSGGRLSRACFEARAMNPADKTTFRIVVTKDDEWRVRIVQVSNHIRLDGVEADRDLIVHAVNRFAELAGMREAGES
uniref:Uncharacterized protein n=1 Tax=Siphoviridae sp. ctQ091 TaxID=2825490 RepID=A0A8S5NUN8_9CAUD|nr:MAG TPA: hypothetical protein [Siphoviridae sp. ctQ091]